MSFWAVLPVKPFKQGKTRLAGVLSDDERYVLNMTMLGNTLTALRQTKSIDQILVVSPDSGVLSVSRDFGVRTLQEDAPSNLNRAVTLGVRFAMAGLADRVMVIPADIPLLEARFIQELIDHLSGARQMVIVPDRHEDGTNGLLLSAPGGFEFQFGKGSFQRHIKQAEELGLRVEIVRTHALGLDLDLPEDLDLLCASMLNKT